MIHDILYKRAKTGAIQFWQIETKGSTIVKTAGKLGTKKPLIHEEHISVGKQGRTQVQQAEAQALSDWKRKHDEGYKSINDLGLSPTCFPHELDAALSEFNTDAAGEILPMLAPNNAWKEGDKKNTYPKQMGYKLDGVRATMKWDGKEVIVLSRTGKPYLNLGHLNNILKAHAIKNKLKPFVIDGELYKHGLLLEEINEAVRGVNENTPHIEFWMYDYPTNGEKKQTERTEFVLWFVKNLNSAYFNTPVTFIVNSDKGVLELHDEFIKLGFEGGMLKDLDGTYQSGQRSRFWQKVKMFEDNEYEIIGYKLGQRGVEDLTFECKCKDGPFEVKMSGNTLNKQRLYNKIDSLIGKQLTVKHFGFTKYGIPFLPTGKAIREKE